MNGKIKWSQICDKKKYFEKIVTDLWQKNQFDKNCHKIITATKVCFAWVTLCV